MDAVSGTAPAAGGPVRAAGGVVGRGNGSAQAGTEILLVHRPRFDDWSLPKGKLKRGEHPLAGAVREVREETGVLGVPGIRLPTASYEVWAGDALRDKQVDYWAMTLADIGTFTPGDEVDRIAWLPVPDALRRLSYPHDRRVVGAYSDLPPLHRPVVVLAPGVRLGAVPLHLLRPSRLVSGPAARCRATLDPLASAFGLAVEIDEHLDADDQRHTAVWALRRLADPEVVSVVCGESVGAAVARLARSSGEAGHACLVLSFSGEDLVAADPLT